MVRKRGPLLRGRVVTKAPRGRRKDDVVHEERMMLLNDERAELE